MSLNIASVNVNGIRAATKVRNENNPGMLAWLEETSADVVLMQEVRATQEQAEAALVPAIEQGWHVYFAPAAAKGRAGVGIASRTELDDVRVGIPQFEDSGRFIAGTLDDGTGTGAPPPARPRRGDGAGGVGRDGAVAHRARCAGLPDRGGAPGDIDE